MLTVCAWVTKISSQFQHFFVNSRILHPMVWGGSVNSLAFILKNYFVSAWEDNILKQLPHLTALQIIQSSYFSCGESSTMAVYHIIIMQILNMFLKTLHILLTDIKVVGLNFSYHPGDETFVLVVWWRINKRSVLLDSVIVTKDHSYGGL